MGKVRDAVPVFLGVFFGIFLIVSHLSVQVGGATLAVLALVGRGGHVAAKARLFDTPARAVMIWQVAIVTPIAVIAVTTFLTTYVAFEAAGWLAKLPDTWVNKTLITDRSADLQKVLLGAMNGLIAAIWLDNAKDPTSTFWPSGQIKAALGSTFQPTITAMKKANYPHTALQDAVSLPAGGPGISGWTYAMLAKRATVIEEELKKWRAASSA